MKVDLFLWDNILHTSFLPRSQIMLIRRILSGGLSAPCQQQSIRWLNMKGCRNMFTQNKKSMQLFLPELYPRSIWEPPN